MFNICSVFGGNNWMIILLKHYVASNQKYGKQLLHKSCKG